MEDAVALDLGLWLDSVACAGFFRFRGDAFARLSLDEERLFDPALALPATE
eukprot:COSAG02_NODE_51453_length_314_cov_0.702326_1_plen_50_part_10